MNYRVVSPLILIVALLLAGATADAEPTWWTPGPGTTWQWQLTGTIDTSHVVAMYDIDLFDAPQAVIDGLHADGRVVICYFSAGSFENWRPDASSFPGSVKGSPLDGWQGERWLDIRNFAVLGPIMESRLDLAVNKGCNGVEPDNVDGYSNDTGFPLTYGDQLAYNLWLAAEAHERGLSIGLKNDLDQIPDLVTAFDWALNEQCFQFDECDLLAPFVDADKAIFGVEYLEEGGDPRSYCPVAEALGFAWLVKTYDLGPGALGACSDYLPVILINPTGGAVVVDPLSMMWQEHAAGVEYRWIVVRVKNGKKFRGDWLSEAGICAGDMCSVVFDAPKPGDYTLKIKTRWPGAVKKPASAKVQFTIL